MGPRIGSERQLQHAIEQGQVEVPDVMMEKPKGDDDDDDPHSPVRGGHSSEELVKLQVRDCNLMHATPIRLIAS